MTANPGREQLDEWFGPRYTSFLVLPRILMHEMPDEWQHKMADLLHEFTDEYPGLSRELGTRVTYMRHNRFVKPSYFLLNYRQPDLKTVDELRYCTDASKALKYILNEEL